MPKRDFLKAAGLAIAQRILPASLGSHWALSQELKRRNRRVILVTFGGGVRYTETFAPEGLRNIPRLASLRGEGHFFRSCFNSGVLSHFNSTASICTGQWQRVDDFGFEPPGSATLFELYRKARKAGPLDAWVIATNKSFAVMGASNTRDFGQKLGANVVLPKQLLLESVKDIVTGRKGADVSDRDAVLRRLEDVLREGYEGVGWTIFKGGQKLDREVQAALTRGLAEFIHGPEAPTSGDELTFFIAREVMREFAPHLMLVNFWDMDVAHWGSYSLYLQAVTKTDRLTGMLWDEVQANPKYKDQTVVLVLPELGRDGDINAANGFLNHRSGDESCRRMWMLALGAGVNKGETERPVSHVDMTPTALGILGVDPPPGLAGRVLPEILV